MTNEIKRAPAYMREGAKTYEERNAVYGDNYVLFGDTMMSLFPQGLHVATAEDWNRLGILVQQVSKLSRYTANFHRGGHPDSTHDLMVYTAMLSELDGAYYQLHGEQQSDEDHRQPGTVANPG